jgi:hypothetical protein
LEEAGKQDGRLVLVVPGHAADEPLAVLADKHGFDVYSNSGATTWRIRLEQWDGIKFPGAGPFFGKTYIEAEAKARAYLNGLEDTPRPTGEGGKV